MDTIIINGDIRKNINKKELYHLRKYKNIPCILYNIDTNIKFYTPVNDLKKVIYTKKNYLITLKLKINKKYNEIKSILKNFQLHPVSDEILHVDFYKISDNSPITINVPIKIIGKSPGISKGGEYSFPLKKLKINALPNNMPNNILLNVSSMEIGDRIIVKDIFKKKYSILHSYNSVIIAVRNSRVSLKSSDLDNSKEKNSKEKNSKENNSKENNSKENNSKEK